MPRLFCLLALLTLLLSPGCGITAKKMDPAAVQHIHTIALLDVAVTKQRTYVDPPAMATSAIVLGDVGALANAAVSANIGSQLDKAMPDAAYPSRMLSEELAAALERKAFIVRRIPDGPPSHRAEVGGSALMNDGLFVKDYSKVPVPDADAVLDVVCVTFGYERFSFTQIDHPMIQLAVRLTSPDGKTIYYAQGVSFAQNDSHRNDCTPIDADRKQFAASWSDVFKDKKLLDDQLRIAARSLGDAIAHDVTAGK